MREDVPFIFVLCLLIVLALWVVFTNIVYTIMVIKSLRDIRKKKALAERLAPYGDSFSR